MNNAPISEINIDKLALRTQYTVRIALIFIAAFLGTSGLYFYLALSSKAWQFNVLTGVTVLVTLANVAAFRLGQLKRIETAAIFMIGGMAILFPTATMLVSGVGLVLGLGAILAIIMVASLILVSPLATRAIIIGIVIGAIGILLDAFFPFSYQRLDVPILQTFIPVVAAIGLGVFAYFISREFGNYSLRTKLLTAFIIVALIAVGIPGFFINRSTSVRLTADAGERLVQQGGTYAALVGEVLTKEVGSLETLSLNTVIQELVVTANASHNGSPAVIYDELQRLDKQWRAADAANNDSDPLVAKILNNSVATELLKYRSSFPENSEIFVTDEYGASLASTNRTSDYYQADEAWWQATYNNGAGNLYIGEPEYDQSSATYGSIIGVPIYAPNSRHVIGILRTTLDISTITSLLKSFKLGETGELELYVSGNQRLPATGGSLIAGDPAAILLKDNIYVLVNYGGRPSIVSTSPLSSLDKNMADVIKGLGWSIVIHQDEQESLAPVTRQTQTVILISFLILGLAGAVAFFAAQLITQPVTSLTTVASQIAAGNFEAHAQINTQDEIGLLAGTFNTMAAELQKLIGSLEQRVAERTFDLAQASRESEQRAQDLRSIAEISSSIVSEQKLEKLLPLIVGLISEKFSYYHTGIFLVDVSGRYAVLQAASSQGGQRMLARGHRLEVGQTGLVGFVAQTGRARIALDVGADAVFFSNPDLPETRSEMALPLNIRGETIGVLDVQSEQPGAFSQTDIETLSVLADQVAIAIDNARLFGEAQQTLAETQALYAQFLGQQWQGFLKEEQQIGYQHTLRGGEKLNVALDTPVINRALRRGEVVVQNPTDEPALMVIPVRLRNQVIGVLNIQALTKHQAWSQDEINMVQAVSDRLALTLETARLFQEAQRRATTERAIGDVATKLATAQDIDSILRLTTEELSKLLSNSKIAIQINPAVSRKQ